MTIPTLTDLDLREKRVLVRVDFNVPIASGRVANDARIKAALPTIQHALGQDAAVLLVSHLGRPKPGVQDATLSLAPVAAHLATLLGQSVELVNDWQNGVQTHPKQVQLLENIRFHAGETDNDEKLARQLAALCDIYVNDAFGTAHRAHASTHGIAKFSPQACAGLLLDAEIQALDKALAEPKRPLVAVLGGAKVSGKLQVLHHLKDLADTLLVGGGMANTFLLAEGIQVGHSLVEPELTTDAKAIRCSADLPLPVDLMTSQSIDDNHSATLRLRDEIPGDELVVDIGPETARRYAAIIQEAGTVIWNGPMGVFEETAFADGTRIVAEAIAASPAFSLAGGGDTIAAIEKFQLEDHIDYISTGGGAFLEFVEGKTLPGIEVLSRSKNA